MSYIGPIYVTAAMRVQARKLIEGLAPIIIQELDPSAGYHDGLGQLRQDDQRRCDRDAYPYVDKRLGAN